MNEMSVLENVLNDLRSDKFNQYIKDLQLDNESEKILGKAQYPFLTPQESRQSIAYNLVEEADNCAGVVSVGSTEYPNMELSTLKQINQGVVKIAAEQKYTMEDEDELERIKATLSKSGDVDYMDLINVMDFTKRPSCIYKAIYRTQNNICWVGSTAAEQYRKSKDASSVSLSSSAQAYGVLDNPNIRGDNDARCVSSETKWAEKYSQEGGAESIIKDIVNLKNTLDNGKSSSDAGLTGKGISDTQKQLILPRSLVNFLKQNPYDKTNNLGRKLYYEILDRIGFTENQIVACDTLDLFATFKGTGIMMVKDSKYFGCINSEALPLQDEYRKDTKIISANAKSGGFKCAYPNAIRLIKGLA